MSEHGSNLNMSFTIQKKTVSIKKLQNSFLNIYGISSSTLNHLKNFLGFNSNISLKNLSVSQIQKIKLFFETQDSPFFLNDRLRNMQNSVKRLMDLKCYKGIRHKLHLPVHGQRTHSNSKTCKKRFIIKEQKIINSIVKFKKKK